MGTELTTNKHPDLYENSYWQLTQNATKCDTCADLIQSGSRHDFVRCRCGAVAVDGGLSYVRRAFSGPYTDDCIWTALSESQVRDKIRYFQDLDQSHGSNSWTDFIQAGKRLLKDWYDQTT